MVRVFACTPAHGTPVGLSLDRPTPNTGDIDMISLPFLQACSSTCRLASRKRNLFGLENCQHQLFRNSSGTSPHTCKAFWSPLFVLTILYRLEETSSK